MLRALWMWMAVATAWGQAPQLVQIQDVVYRADGQRFNGIALVEWRTFLAANYASVAAYSRTIPIVDGVLQVSLTPTTNVAAGAFYEVKYNSAGRIAFTEFWAVPPSSTTLKLKDIRLAGPPVGGNALTGGGLTGPILISDVTGLTDALTQRVKKGLGYLPSGAAVINSTGDLDAAVGNASDCVRVDGSSGPCGSGSGGAVPGFVDAEAPAGLVNGSNTTFTLANTPSPASSLVLYRNGILQKQGLDFSLTGNAISFLVVAPQSGDVMQASYRLPASGAGGSTSGQAGGALTGFFPAPQLAPGVVTNVHVSATAGILESKLALNFPTHGNGNDPTPEQKAAMAGTAGLPGTANRFVTDSDPRMTNARTAVSHSLLSSAHGDTTTATVARGDLIVGQGTAPSTWTRLSLGPANRCLISNGADAVWNSCLYTGFAAGSVPVVDGQGNLSQTGTLLWDGTARRFSLGTTLALGTLTVQDGTTGSGVTSVVVRAGDGQAATALQRWQDVNGNLLAQVQSDGGITAAAVRAATSATRAAWRDSGAASDPSGVASGDAWYNSGVESRKSVEAAQTHTQPQVICAAAGTGTSSATLVTLGTCTIPAGMIQNGDRIEVRFDYSHEGTAQGLTFEVRWGTTALYTRSAGSVETNLGGKMDVNPAGSTIYWSSQCWGAALAMQTRAGTVTGVPAGATSVTLTGKVDNTAADTITLRNFTVIRYPGQTNP